MHPKALIAVILGCIAHAYIHIYKVFFFFFFFGIYRYIYIGFFWLHIESWSEWDLNLQPHAYNAHALTNELSDQTIVCA